MASTSTAEMFTVMKKSPNWLAMPDELMSNIFQRLHTVEKLTIARKVCTTWWKICKDPAMWKVIHMHNRFHTIYNYTMLTKQAVDLSCGELIDITLGDYRSTDDLLYHIALRSSKLKRLCIGCCKITGSGLSGAVKSIPQLEELFLCYSTTIDAEDIEVIGRNCPQLKSFKMEMSTLSFRNLDNHAVAISNNMPKLRHLRIYGVKMTNNGIQAILNGCPHLESLDIEMCHSLNLDKNLVKKCMERIKDFKHTDCNSSVEND